MNKILLSAATVLLFLLLLLLFTLFTSHGFSLAIGIAHKVSGGSFTVEKSSGSLGSSFAMENMSLSTAKMSINLNSLNVSWSPAALFGAKLHVQSLTLDGLHIRSTVDEVDEEDAGGPITLPEYSLPLAVAIDSLKIKDIQYESGSSTPLQIDEIDMTRLAGQKILQLKSISLQSNNLAFSIGGTIGIGDGWPVDITGNWRYSSGSFADVQGSCALGQTLENGVVELQMTTPAKGGLRGRFSIDKSLFFQAEINASDFDPSVFSRDINGLLDVHITGQGELSEDGLTAEVLVDGIEGTLQSFPLQLTGKARYGSNQVNIETLNVHSRDSQLQLSGILADELDLAFSLEIKGMDDFVPEIKGRALIEGKVTGELQTPQIEAVAQAHSLSVQDVLVEAFKANFTLKHSTNPELAVDLQLNNISGHGQKVEEMIVAAQGSLTKHRINMKLIHEDISLVLESSGSYAHNAWRGTVDRFSLASGLQGNYELTENAIIKAGSKSFSVDGLCLSRASASICLEGGLEEKIWRAEALVKHFDPGFLLSDWPGDISAQLSGHGTLSGAQSAGYFELVNITGNLKEIPLSGRGEVGLTSSELAVEELTLHYGEADLTANGVLDRENVTLAFSGDVPDIGLFLENGKGQLSLVGSIAGTPGAPQLELAIEAEDVIMEHNSVQRLEVDVAADLHKGGTVSASLNGYDLKRGNSMVQQLSFAVDGTVETHSFNLKIVNDALKAEAKGRGSYDSSWQGSLQSASAATRDYGSWHLAGTTALYMDNQGAEVKDFCLAGQGGDFCFSGNAAKDGSWRVDSTMDSLSLSLLSDYGLIDMPVKGAVNGQVSAGGIQQKLKSIEGFIGASKIELSGGSSIKRLNYNFFENRLDLTMAGESLKITLASNFEKQGEVRGELFLRNFNEKAATPTDMPIDGTLDFHLADLTFISLLTDFYLQPTGVLSGNLDFGGTLSNPTSHGDINLEDGEVYLSDLGITLREISAKIHNEQQQLQYILTAASGPGKARGEGMFGLGFGSGWKLTSHLTGENFELLADDEYTIHSSADIHLLLEDGKNSLTGSLTIPYGRAKLENEKSKVSASGDVVFVDDEADVKQRDSELAIDLQVNLGEDVKIDAYGLKSKLKGALKLEDSPGRILSAFGELVVSEGVFTFYSVELDVIRGRLLFSGGSIENPGVDFRARRKVEKQVVGVEAGGTAQELQFQLFSDPSMDESNILAYLLVGRSMYASKDNDQSLIDAAASALGIRGVNALTSSLEKYVPVDEIYLDGSTGDEDISIVVGKYITDDLFIGYDYNFFDASNAFKARYNLGNNFWIETRSSVNSTSGDILYSIER